MPRLYFPGAEPRLLEEAGVLITCAIALVWYYRDDTDNGLRWNADGRGRLMVTAISLLTVERDKVNDVAEQLADMKGVSEVYSVAGRYDLAVIIRVKDNDDLAELVTEHIRSVPGIIKSETLIAFRVYSRHDLESMFAIGME
jgi:DNA-binding Lrp family transcriptional regulator